MAIDLEDQYDKIYKYCYFKVYNTEIAEDITQETFLRFFNQNLELDKNKELPYLYTIAKNLCIEEYRKNKNQANYSMDNLSYNDPTEKLVDSIVIKKVMTKLSDEDREVLLLRYVNELPVSDICKILGISRFSLYRKTKSLLKFLKEELRNGGFSHE